MVFCPALDSPPLTAQLFYAKRGCFSSVKAVFVLWLVRSPWDPPRCPSLAHCSRTGSRLLRADKWEFTGSSPPCLSDRQNVAAPWTAVRPASRCEGGCSQAGHARVCRTSRGHIPERVLKRLPAPPKQCRDRRGQSTGQVAQQPWPGGGGPVAQASTCRLAAAARHPPASLSGCRFLPRAERLGCHHPLAGRAHEAAAHLPPGTRSGREVPAQVSRGGEASSQARPRGCAGRERGHRTGRGAWGLPPPPGAPTPAHGRPRACHLGASSVTAPSLELHPAPRPATGEEGRRCPQSSRTSQCGLVGNGLCRCSGVGSGES